MQNNESDNFFRKIVIVEDNKDLNEVYKLILQGVKGYNVVGTYYSCEEALPKIKKTIPDLVLMDLELSGMNGIEGIKQIKELKHDIKVMVITVHEDNESVFNAISAGAVGYITKKSDHNQLIKSVDKALMGGNPLSEEITKMMVKSFQRNPNTPFTRREVEVLEQLAMGKTYQYISKALSISYDTVKTHIKHIYWKLEVDNKSEAVIKAKSENYI